MANYFRITAYHPATDLSVIVDSNGKFEKLWQFSAYLVSKGFKVLEVGRDELLIDAGYKKVSEPSGKVLRRGYAKGMPSIQEVTFENRPCKAIAVPNMAYGLFLS